MDGTEVGGIQLSARQAGGRRAIAIVVQRYGLEVNGGAEQHARWLAERLAPTADLTVLTTCALDYITWADHYPPGEEMINGVRVRRFPVDAQRDWKKAQRQTRLVTTHRHTLFDEAQWVHDQGPYATPLFEAIRRAYETTDAFIFYTFHYAPTAFGLPLVSDKAFLVPTAHDDPFVRMGVFRPLFHLPRGIFYLTEPERQLVQRATRNAAVPNTVTGVGVELPIDASAERFRHKFGLREPFLLYVGRVHESKNVPELLDYFIRYRQENDAPLKLVLIGKSHLRLPDHPDILHLGFLPEADKQDAIAAATLVVLPSLYESLSMITLEAWAGGVPVLVNEQCEVVKYLCRQSNGGLYYRTHDEFTAALQRLLGSESLRRQMGNQGRQFVVQHYRPEVVLQHYTTLLDAASSIRRGAASGR
jgi:glycosyltransferase involved in cell wall biosynthesis